MKQQHNFKELKIWRKAKEFVLITYKKSANLPDEERFGLIQQMRRSAVSIPSNIAEGSGRKAPKDFIRFLNIAAGSLFELETQYILCEELRFLSNLSEVKNRISELKRMIFAFIKHIIKESESVSDS